MTTEITDIKNGNGWVCFDAECTLCTRLAYRFGPLLRRHRFALVPLQTTWVKERLTGSGEELLFEMRLLTPQGRVYGGADALAEIARHIWWAKPFYLVSRVPLARSALRTGYRWVARHRTCRRAAAGRKRPRSIAFFEMP